MNTRQLLEKDKEQFKTRLAAANDADEAARVCEQTLNRILLQYNEQAPSDALRKAASTSLTTVRAALPLINSAGEIQTYERTLPAEKKPGGWVPLGIGAGLSAGAAALFMAAPAAFAPVGLALLIGGLAGIFISGLQFGRKKGVVPKTEQILEVRPDPDKIYHNLLGLLTVEDQYLEDVGFEDRRGKELPGPAAVAAAALPEDQLQLLSGILESAYARSGDPDAEAVVSNVRFYLHKKGVEVLDYRLPAISTGSLPGEREPSGRPCFMTILWW